MQVESKSAEGSDSTTRRFCINDVVIEIAQSELGPNVTTALANGQYEGKEFAALQKLLKADDTFFEIGAGVGYLSSAAWKTLRTPGRIFAYEANPIMIPVIQRTWELNGVDGQLINCILGDGEGMTSFNVSREFWASSATVSTNVKQVVDVAQRDFASELARTRPSVLVMDIEGGERDLLLGRPLPLFVRKIIVELHPNFIGGRICSEIVKHLLQQGFTLCFDALRGTVFSFQR